MSLLNISQKEIYIMCHESIQIAIHCDEPEQEQEQTTCPECGDVLVKAHGVLVCEAFFCDFETVKGEE